MRTVAAIAVLLSRVTFAASVDAQSVSFRQQVAPILVRRCLATDTAPMTCDERTGHGRSRTRIL